MKILIVEDDTLLLQGLILAAQTEGYACDGVTTARMAEQSLEAGHYSLVVLDLGLPDEDGLHFLARIRQKKYTLPVLILTARDTLTDKIAELGTTHQYMDFNLVRAKSDAAQNGWPGVETRETEQLVISRKERKGDSHTR